MRVEVQVLYIRVPNAVWRDLHHRRAYADAFLRAPTEIGWLAPLIPTRYAGFGSDLWEAAAALQEIN